MIEQDNSIITRAIRSIEASHDIDAQMVMIAIGALERQDAKIIPIRNGDEFAPCPNCGHDLIYHREGFCEWCGQKYKMVNEGERKMTNRGWIDLLSKEFSVSRASARDMFYAIFKRLLTHYQIKRMNRRMSDGRT